MDNVNLEEIAMFLNERTYLASGKEGKVYRLGDEVVKIFYDHNNDSFERLDDNRLRLLASLDLKAFNNITGFVEKCENDQTIIVGCKEKYLEHEQFQIEHLFSNEIRYNLFSSLDDIKDDIKLLSEHGFIILEIENDYFYKNGKLSFSDMTSYMQEDVKGREYKELLKRNYRVVSLFLIGLLIYNGYKNKNSIDDDKIISVKKYYEKNCKDKYFGDILKEMCSIEKNYRITKKV